MNVSISKVRSPLWWIQLSPDGRIMRIMANSLTWALNHSKPDMLDIYKAYALSVMKEGLVVWKILCWFDWDLNPRSPAWKADTLTTRPPGLYKNLSSISSKIITLGFANLSLLILHSSNIVYGTVLYEASRCQREWLIYCHLPAYNLNKDAIFETTVYMQFPLS